MDRWARIEQAPDYEVSTSGEVRPDVAAIRAQHARGDTQTVISAAHGVTRSLVSMIVNRKVWTHVA